MGASVGHALVALKVVRSDGFTLLNFQFDAETSGLRDIALKGNNDPSSLTSEEAEKVLQLPTCRFAASPHRSRCRPGLSSSPTDAGFWSSAGPARRSTHDRSHRAPLDDRVAAARRENHPRQRRQHLSISAVALELFTLARLAPTVEVSRGSGASRSCRAPSARISTP